MSTPLLKPNLYAPGNGADADGAPVLLGGRCRCGFVFFPMQTFGCERCGATGDALEPMRLRGRGKLEDPIGPTGVGQIAEITLQLRGEAGERQQPDAKAGLAHMVGLGSVCDAHVLQRA